MSTLERVTKSGRCATKRGNVARPTAPWHERRAYVMCAAPPLRSSVKVIMRKKSNFLHQPVRIHRLEVALVFSVVDVFVNVVS